jgi:hypothetical protein
MAVIQQSRLKHVLSVAGLSAKDLVQLAASPDVLVHLLEQQSRLDRLTHLAEQLETALGAEVGWPRVIVERDDQSLAFVTSAADIEALRAEQHLASEDALWLKRQLQKQRGRWVRANRRSGLHALRRRERRLGDTQDRAIRRYLRHTGTGVAGVLPQLIVLIATLEAGWQADALTSIVRRLTTLVSKQ